MEYISQLRKIKELYKQGENIIQYLTSQSKLKKPSIESIMISYDLQAGNYIKKASKYVEQENIYANKLASIINDLGINNSILEVGIGEATTFSNVYKRLNHQIEKKYGLDISWSRLMYANLHLKNKGIKNVNTLLADMNNAPFLDNSIDIVYTSHSIEPNRGQETEILTELYRITGKYLILFEPSNELGNEKAKSYIDKHKYVKNLYNTAKKLNYNIIEHKILFENNPLSDNNTAVLIIKKDLSDSINKAPLACPVTKTPLAYTNGCYFSKMSMLAYPILNKIPCLMLNNAVIATHFDSSIITDIK